MKRNEPPFTPDIKKDVYDNTAETSHIAHIDVINELYEGFSEEFSKNNDDNIKWLKDCINDFMRIIIKSYENIKYDMHTSATLIHKLAVFINKNSKDINEELIKQFKEIVYEILSPLYDIKLEYYALNNCDKSIDYMFCTYDYIKQYNQGSKMDQSKNIPETRPEAIHDFAKHILFSLKGMEKLYNFVEKNKSTLINSLSDLKKGKTLSSYIQKLCIQLENVLKEPFIKTEIFVTALSESLNKVKSDIEKFDETKLSKEPIAVTKLTATALEKKFIFDNSKGQQIFEYYKDKFLISTGEFSIFQNKTDIKNDYYRLNVSKIPSSFPDYKPFDSKKGAGMNFKLDQYDEWDDNISLAGNARGPENQHYLAILPKQKEYIKIFSLTIDKSYLDTKSNDIIKDINTVFFHTNDYITKSKEVSKYFTVSAFLITNINKNQLLCVQITLKTYNIQLIVNQDGQIFSNCNNATKELMEFVEVDNTKKIPLLGAAQFFIKREQDNLIICAYQMSLNIKLDFMFNELFNASQFNRSILAFDTKNIPPAASNFKNKDDETNSELENSQLYTFNNLLCYIDINFKEVSFEDKQNALIVYCEQSINTTKSCILKNIMQCEVKNSRYLNKQIKDLICEFMDVYRINLNKYNNEDLKNTWVKKISKTLFLNLFKVGMDEFKDLTEQTTMCIIKLAIEKFLHNDYTPYINHSDFKNLKLIVNKIKLLIENDSDLKLLNYGADVLYSLISIDDTTDLDAADSIYNEVANYVYDAKRKNYENMNIEHFSTQTSEQEIRLMEGEYNMHLAAKKYNINLLAGENDMNLIGQERYMSEDEDDMSLIGQERYMSEDSE